VTTNQSIRPSSILRRYALALVLVGVSLWLSLTLHSAVAGPFWVLFPIAVLVSNWYGGRGPGWFAAVSAALAVQYYLFPPVHQFTLRSEDIPLFVCFVGIQVLANWVITWRKQAEEAVRRTSEELVAKVFEQQRTDQALQQTRLDLARISRVIMVGELAASIAHEVNQPLAAVVANSDACLAWLSATPPNLDEAREAAKQAGEGAIYASEVIRRIRSLINNAPAERSVFQMNELIRETIAITIDQATMSGIDVVTKLAPELPEVVADRIQLQQVFINLMTNAIASMSDIKRRPLRLEVESHSDGDEEIHISVTDTGVGVSAELLPRLFEPFYTTRSQGLGMGLPISRSIIEAHGGRLWVDSVPGEGSKFQMTLPLQAKKAA
jgi:signal transduction histidine kinase